MPAEVSVRVECQVRSGTNPSASAIVHIMRTSPAPLPGQTLHADVVDKLCFQSVKNSTFQLEENVDQLVLGRIGSCLNSPDLSLTYKIVSRK